MKLQVSVVLWSVLKSLVLALRFVATSHFICIVARLAGLCMVRVSADGDFQTDSSICSTFLMFLTL